MKKIYIIVLLLFVASAGFAQDRYAILLNDKNGTSFSLSNPSAYLSTRAIARRAQANIVIDSTDLPVNTNYVTAIQATGAVILNTSKWLNEVTVDVSSNPSVILAAINNLSFVKQSLNIGRYAGGPKPNVKFDFMKMNSNYIQQQTQRVANTNLFYDYGDATNQITMLNGDVLHDMGYRGNGKIIAMLDAGYFNADNMTVFDSLRANNRILYTYDFVDHQTNVYDDDTHGAMCFSTMGANIGGSMVGTAPEASYMLFRSEDNTSENIIEEYNWATAAEFADSAGADIISSSLGYTEFDDASQNHTYADMNGQTAPCTKAAVHASAKGMVVVNSAGNSGNGSWHYIGAPADADNIITVGAVDAFENYASFSSTGPSSDGRIKPTVSAQGQGTFVASPSGGVFPGNGTSFSCPVIAGMVACLWQSTPSATYLQVIQAIIQSASQYANPDSLMGYGIPNFDIARTTLLSINNPFFGKGDFLKSVYPNPFKNNIAFDFYTDSNRQYIAQVFDMAGKLVYSTEGNFNPYIVTHVNMPLNVTKGLYVLRLTTDNSVYKAKLLKQ